MVDVQGPCSFNKDPLQIRARGDKEIAGYSPRRILALSKPKETKQIWLTSFGPNLKWGQQDTMWPLPASTLKRHPTRRLLELTKPKRNFQLGTLKVNRPEFAYSCGRSSGIWSIKEGLIGKASDRVLELAKPKYPPPEFRDQRAYCSERVAELARHRQRNEGPFIDSRSPEESIRKVSDNARVATASPRLLEMAKFKGFADGYVPNRAVQWSISRATRRATATPRQEQLSTPIIRATMDHVQFNPDAFLVSEAAKKARCTPRLEELAQPIQR